MVRRCFKPRQPQVQHTHSLTHSPKFSAHTLRTVAHNHTHARTQPNSVGEEVFKAAAAAAAGESSGEWTDDDE